MKVLPKIYFIVILSFLISKPTFGTSIAVEYLHSLGEIKVNVTAPVYEPIPGVDRLEVEHKLERVLSDLFRSGGFVVSEDASVAYRVDISYVESGSDIIFLVQGQLLESAQLDREWAGDKESIRVITWQDTRLIRASHGIVGDKLTEASGRLAVDLIERVQEARAAWRSQHPIRNRCH